jgi:hypothetical protein
MPAKGEGEPEHATYLGGPYEFGELKEQGKRSDLIAVADLCKQGDSLVSIADAYPSQFIRYHGGVTKYHAMCQPPRGLDEETVCFVFYGSGGAGKTSFALRLAQYLGPVFRVAQAKGSGLYFDRYKQGDVVIIDEFKGSRMLPTFFNEMVDMGPFDVPVHGGSVPFNSKYVIITTNVHPKLWWPNVQFQHSLRRRIIMWPIFRNLAFIPKKRSRINGVSELMAYEKSPFDLNL